MSNQTLLKSTPSRRTPVPNADKPAPGVEHDQPVLFVESAELGQQLSNLHHLQVEIDRRAAEELARVRMLQNRD